MTLDGETDQRGNGISDKRSGWKENGKKNTKNSARKAFAEYPISV
jgi:hypothetical protein